MERHTKNSHWYHSFELRFTLLLLLIGVLPAATVGWIAQGRLFEKIREDRIRTVGMVAEAKHSQLNLGLVRARERAELFLQNLGRLCDVRNLKGPCAEKQVWLFLESENAQGAVLLWQGGRLDIGHFPAGAQSAPPLPPEQLARLAGTGAANQSYYIEVGAPGTGLRMRVAYPSTNFQLIFDRPPDLGESGEAFLADGAGYLVTESKYSVAQGHSIPIHVQPMQTCLAGRDGEMLDIDYIGRKIIHGFRTVPELGGACVMAHIDQDEAFAPLALLQKKLAALIFAFMLLVLVVAIYIARKVAQPIQKLGEAKARLEQSEERVRLTVKAGNIGLWERDLLNDTVHFSPELKRQVGYAEHELRDDFDEWKTRVHPDDLGWVMKAVRDYIEGRRPDYRAEYRLRHRDGNYRWVLSQASLEYDAAGLPVRLLGSQVDITERKRAELLALQYKAAIDITHEGFCLVDEHGVVIKVNGAYAAMIGYAPEELIGMQAALLEAKARTREEVEAHVARVMAHGWDAFETRLRRRDGAAFEVEVSVSYIAESRQFVAFVRDITDRKKIELEQKIHKEVLDTAQDGFWRYDRSGILLEVNRAYADMMGYTVEELVGTHISQLSLARSSPEAVAQRIEAIFASGGHATFETRQRHRDGHIVYLETSNSWLPEANCMFSFLRDIGGRKAAEEQQRVAAAAFETHEAILITDAAANIIRVNHAFTDITGYSAEDVLGKNPRILNSGRQDRAFFAAMWQQLLETGSWSGEIWDRRKNGQVYPKWMTITAVKNDAGETTEYVAIFSDITARKEAEQEIYSLAFYDPLTRLPNRRNLLDRFRQAQAISARSGQYGAVLYLDMDRFKTLNDMLGHDYGDVFLVEVGQRMLACARESDTVARIGGDEFVVLLEEIGLEAEEVSQRVALVAEKIRSALTVSYLLNGHEYPSSPSIGVCLYRGNEQTIDTLLKHADLAMYHAKASGRNAVCFFDPAMQHAVETRAALEADLRSAIGGGQLRLYYQIQMDRDLSPFGAEALIRWLHPVRGMVMPGQFIPIAEESALILDIGLWVLESACKQLAAWAEADATRHLVLAVNVSAAQFQHPDFVRTVTALIHLYGVSPDRLKLELTESVIMENMAEGVEKMHALKALGVQLSLDDFGTGYSSLSYLKRLPLDQIKIDQSFVRDIATDPNDAVMVQTIIQLAASFRMNVIAEGVETEAQHFFLDQHGCMAYQGYLFGRPVPIEEFEAQLGRAGKPDPRLRG